MVENNEAVEKLLHARFAEHRINPRREFFWLDTPDAVAALKPYELSDATPEVRAAADGEILYTGWLRGYGQVVIIDHGGNLTTVYAHLSAIDTTENAKVKAGDVVGKVGSTGTATGNHLHFEVRVNGSTTDPLTYLNK